VAAGTESWTCTSCKTSYTPTWDPDLEDYVDLPAFSSFGGAYDDDHAVAELRRLADGDDQALDDAIPACLAQPASLAARRRAIELLAPALYEWFPPTP
jgi:hypothetical protein